MAGIDEVEKPFQAGAVLCGHKRHLVKVIDLVLCEFHAGATAVAAWVRFASRSAKNRSISDLLKMRVPLAVFSARSWPVFSYQRTVAPLAPISRATSLVNNESS